MELLEFLSIVGIAAALIFISRLALAHLAKRKKLLDSIAYMQAELSAMRNSPTPESRKEDTLEFLRELQNAPKGSDAELLRTQLTNALKGGAAPKEIATLSNEKKETIEEAFKRLGIEPLPPDDPIYQQGYSMNFVPPGRQSTPATPQPLPPVPPEPQKRKPLDFQIYMGMLLAAVPAGNGLGGSLNPEVIRAYLTLAAEDGHDWRELYRRLGAHRPPDWQPLPPEEQVAPNLKEPPKK